MLTSDKKRLTIFESGIRIDQNLPKWVNAKRRAEMKEKGEVPVDKNYNNYPVVGDDEIELSEPTPFLSFPTTSSSYKLGNDVEFDEIATANLNELSEIIFKKKIYNITSGYIASNSNFADSTPRPVFYDAEEKHGFGAWLKRVFKKKPKERLPKDFMSAAEFFANVKLTTKEATEKYRDRVSRYLKAIHMAKVAGQTALVENLLKEMIANKYESLLDAEGFYYVISEDDVVRFAKKTEKGLKLSYIENFARPIPEKVIDKLQKANSLEIFDNYVVLYFDPKGKVYKETEEQRAKRKDPILFGVISGSNKLYYVADWIDEYCDLTLEKFVDTLGTTKDNMKIFKD